MSFPYRRVVWGGFVNGRLSFTTIDDGFGGWGVTRRPSPALFTSKPAALREYTDVRPVELCEWAFPPRGARS